MLNLERLWTPWRMQYVGGVPDPEAACVFCALPADTDDVGNLVVHRGDHAYIMMNLFPYNTGHLLIVPYRHVPTPVEATGDELAEIMILTQRLLPVLSRALGNQGANIGINVGEIAGAGIAAHLHQHIVPRWRGDANFMPIVAGTKVLPELLPVTYARIRSEFAASGKSALVHLMCFDRTGAMLLVDAATGTPPTVAPDATNLPVWRQAVAALQEGGERPDLVGWGGSERAVPGATTGLCFVCQAPSSSGERFRWVRTPDGVANLEPALASLVQQAYIRFTENA